MEDSHSYAFEVKARMEFTDCVATICVLKMIKNRTNEVEKTVALLLAQQQC